MIEEYLKLLSNKIEDKILQLQETIGDGNVADFSEYKKMCGEIKGLLTARSYIEDLHERFKKDDDDE
jgi:hypothetical protein